MRGGAAVDAFGSELKTVRGGATLVSAERTCRRAQILRGGLTTSNPWVGGTLVGVFLEAELNQCYIETAKARGELSPTAKCVGWQRNSPSVAAAPSDPNPPGTGATTGVTDHRVQSHPRVLRCPGHLTGLQVDPKQRSLLTRHRQVR